MKKKISIFCCIMFLTGSSMYAQNAPIVIAGTVVSDGSVITVPVTVSNFNDIRSCNLKLNYDAARVTAVAVTTGPLLGGNLASNLGISGVIALGWYIWPGVSLPDNTLIFNITFARISDGPIAITWVNEGSSCQWWDKNGGVLNDLPSDAYYFSGSLSSPREAPLTKAAVVKACVGSSVDVPVMVYSFIDIGAVMLTMQYDPAVLTFQSSGTNPEFSGLTVNNPTPGTISVNGSVPSGGKGITLEAGSVLFTLTFNYSGGSAALTWTDNGTSCEYQGPPSASIILTDSPQSSYFVNGSVTESPVPDAAGTVNSLWGGTVTQGQAGVVYSVSPITNATGYNWSLPVGAEISSGGNTASITVSYGSSAISGVVTVAGFNGCHTGAVSAAFPVTVNLGTGIETFGEDSGDKGIPAITSYPNPFSSQATISYFIPKSGKVSIEILNMLGEKVMQISDEQKTEGQYSISLASVHFSPGIYTARIILKTGDRAMVKAIKMICNSN
ncbi:MAG: cohesin domain-containing protein [Bacteroidia bacterium]|nr:cohesin domain-containing protein [Bacteroidia bacterium]